MLKILLGASLVTSIRSYHRKIVVRDFEIQSYQGINPKNSQNPPKMSITKNKGIIEIRRDGQDSMLLNFTYKETQEARFKPFSYIELKFKFLANSIAFVGQELTYSPSSIENTKFSTLTRFLYFYQKKVTQAQNETQLISLKIKISTKKAKKPATEILLNSIELVFDIAFEILH